ncbi:MAG: transposase [Methanobrevibacter sp.]|nr:transposase [Candidatus Methanovirga basalitermitum]
MTAYHILKFLKFPDKVPDKATIWSFRERLSNKLFKKV